MYKRQVTHSPVFFLELLRKGELKLKNSFNQKVTYHDPCHIGRHAGIYDPPRELLTKIPGVELVEMERIREYAWCCGSGGGVKSAFSDLALFAAKERCDEALRTGAQALVSTCPFCWRNLCDATEAYDLNLKMYDLIELLWESMEK